MKRLLIALLFLTFAFTPSVLAQQTDHHARLTFVTGKQPAASHCRPGTFTLWFNGTNLKYGTNSDCTTWPNFPSASGVTIADGGSLITAGAFAGTLTFTATTDVTFPTTGTLATRAGAETLTNKSIDFGTNTIATTSAQLATALTNETGTGVAVFATSPTLVTPVLGAAAATSLDLGGGVVTDILTGTAEIDFAAITSATCADGGTTITVTGAADGDTVSIGVPAALGATAGVVWSGVVSAADTVTIRGCKISAGDTADLAAGTFRATVIKF